MRATQHEQSKMQSSFSRSNNVIGSPLGATPSTTKHGTFILTQTPQPATSSNSGHISDINTNGNLSRFTKAIQTSRVLGVLRRNRQKFLNGLLGHTQGFGALNSLKKTASSRLQQAIVVQTQSYQFRCQETEIALLASWESHQDLLKMLLLLGLELPKNPTDRLEHNILSEIMHMVNHEETKSLAPAHFFKALEARIAEKTADLKLSFYSQKGEQREKTKKIWRETIKKNRHDLAQIKTLIPFLKVSAALAQVAKNHTNSQAEVSMADLFSNTGMIELTSYLARNSQKPTPHQNQKLPYRILASQFNHQLKKNKLPNHAFLALLKSRGLTTDLQEVGHKTMFQKIVGITDFGVLQGTNCVARFFEKVSIVSRKSLILKSILTATVVGLAFLSFGVFDAIAGTASHLPGWAIALKDVFLDLGLAKQVGIGAALLSGASLASWLKYKIKKAYGSEITAAQFMSYLLKLPIKTLDFFSALILSIPIETIARLRRYTLFGTAFKGVESGIRLCLQNQIANNQSLYEKEIDHLNDLFNTENSEHSENSENLDRNTFTLSFTLPETFFNIPVQSFISPRQSRTHQSRSQSASFSGGSGVFSVVPSPLSLPPIGHVYHSETTPAQAQKPNGIQTDDEKTDPNNSAALELKTNPLAAENIEATIFPPPLDSGLVDSVHTPSVTENERFKLLDRTSFDSLKSSDHSTPSNCGSSLTDISFESSLTISSNPLFKEPFEEQLTSPNTPRNLASDSNPQPTASQKIQETQEIQATEIAETPEASLNRMLNWLKQSPSKVGVPPYNTLFLEAAAALRSHQPEKAFKLQKEAMRLIEIEQGEVFASALNTSTTYNEAGNLVECPSGSSTTNFWPIAPLEDSEQLPAITNLSSSQPQSTPNQPINANSITQTNEFNLKLDAFKQEYGARFRVDQWTLLTKLLKELPLKLKGIAPRNSFLPPNFKPKTNIELLESVEKQIKEMRSIDRFIQVTASHLFQTVDIIASYD